MKLPNFEVIQTDNGLQLVSDAGHRHYKPAIEMLLASEMFVRNNVNIANIYIVALIMIKNNDIGVISDYDLEVPKECDMNDYAKAFIKWANYWVERIDLVLEHSCSDFDIEQAKMQKDLIVPIIELVKKVFQITS